MAENMDLTPVTGSCWRKDTLAKLDGPQGHNDFASGHLVNSETLHR